MRTHNTLTAVGLFSLATVIAAIAVSEFASGPILNPGALSMVATSIVLAASGGTYVGKKASGLRPQASEPKQSDGAAVS